LDFVVIALLQNSSFTELAQEAIMQKWEYLTLLRSRSWDLNNGFYYASDWEPSFCDYNGKQTKIDSIIKYLPQLGSQGWELVSVTPRSSNIGYTGKGYMGSETKYTSAGFTTEELWVFKRPIEG
jgi:hypothetical protein